MKESNQNIILGFKNDAFHHVKLLEALGELNKIVCRSCDYKTNSKGELKTEVNKVAKPANLVGRKLFGSLSLTENISWKSRNFDISPEMFCQIQYFCTLCIFSI